MKNCNTTVPNEQALNTVLSHKRCLAVAVNLLNNPSGLTRKQLEATCGTGYSPNEIEELRWNGGLSIAKVSGSSGQYDFTDDETGEITHQ